MIKKGIALLLVVALTFACVGCGQGEPAVDNPGDEQSNGQNEQNGQEEKQVLVYNLGANPVSIDPTLADDNTGINVLVNTYEGLVKIDDNGNAVPGVAERWDISEDGLEYTFYLREDAKWSDGKPVTAHDFEYSWKRCANPETPGYFSYLLGYLENGWDVVEGIADPEELGVEAIDDTTLKVRLHDPINYIQNIFAFITMVPLREEIVSADEERWTLTGGEIISNGPFYVSEWRQNEEIILVKNENYWNADEVKLDEIQFQMIGDASTALSAFKAGDIDGTMNVPPTEIPNLLAESNEFVMMPALRIGYIEFNSVEAPFDDIRVRQAFTIALDRKALTSRVTLGGERPAVGLVPYGIHTGGEDFRENGGTYGISEEARVEEARRLLAEAGYPNGEGFPELTFNIEAESSIQREAQAIVEMWKVNLNIPDVELLPQESKVHYDDLIEGNYMVGTAGWSADYTHPMSFLDMWISNSGFNETGYSSEEYDQLIEASKSTTDIKESVDLMHQAEDLWMSQYVVCPLYYKGQPVLTKSYVKGLLVDSVSLFHFDNAYIEGKE